MKYVTKVQTVLTASKVVCLILIIVLGAVVLGRGICFCLNWLILFLNKPYYENKLHPYLIGKFFHDFHEQGLEKFRDCNITRTSMSKIHGTLWKSTCFWTCRETSVRLHRSIVGIYNFKGIYTCIWNDLWITSRNALEYYEGVLLYQNNSDFLW